MSQKKKSAADTELLSFWNTKVIPSSELFLSRLESMGPLVRKIVLRIPRTNLPERTYCPKAPGLSDLRQFLSPSVALER